MLYHNNYMIRIFRLKNTPAGVIANIKSSCGVVVAAGVVAAAAVVLLFLGAYGAYYQLHINVQGNQHSKLDYRQKYAFKMVMSINMDELLKFSILSM